MTGSIALRLQMFNRLQQVSISFKQFQHYSIRTSLKCVGSVDTSPNYSMHILFLGTHYDWLLQLDASRQCVAVTSLLTTDHHFSLQKTVPSRRGTTPPSNTWSSWPTPVSIANGISISSAFFAALTNVSNKLSYSVCSNRQLMLHAMQPSNT